MFIKSPLELSYLYVFSGFLLLLKMSVCWHIFQFAYLYEFLKIPCKDASSAFDLFFQTYVGCKARILLITKKQNVSFNLVNQFKCPRRCIRLKIFCILNVQRYEIEFLTFFHAFVFYFIWSFSPMQDGGKQNPKRTPPHTSLVMSCYIILCYVVVMLELSNLGHMSTSTMSFGASDKILLITSWAKVMTLQPFQIFSFFEKACNSKTDIIRIAFTFLQTTFKNSIKVKRIANYPLNWNFYLHFSI